MKYEWDDAKNRKNFAKHGLSFEDAGQVFAGPCVTFPIYLTNTTVLFTGKSGSSRWDCWPGVWWL